MSSTAEMTLDESASPAIKGTIAHDSLPVKVIESRSGWRLVFRNVETLEATTASLATPSSRSHIVHLYAA